MRTRLPRPHPIRFINVADSFGGMLDAHAALGRGEIVCLMGDRLFSPKEPALALPFLGEAALFPVGAYRLAALSDAPMAVLFVLREEYGPESSPYPCGENLGLRLAGIIEPERSASRKAETWRDACMVYIRHLEAVVRDYPYQFFNFYDIWLQETDRDAHSPPGPHSRN